MVNRNLGGAAEILTAQLAPRLIDDHALVAYPSVHVLVDAILHREVILAAVMLSTLPRCNSPSFFIVLVP